MTKRRIAMGVLATVLVWWTVATAGLELGRLTFGTRPSRTLAGTTSFRAGAQTVAKLGFLSRIGGVAFGAVAHPRDGAPTSVRVVYEPRRPDGERIRVQLDGEDLSLGIPDWIAVPTARWASQDSIELVTAFGDVAADGSRERLCRHVFSYADELRGTLLGMRLMQADMVGMVEDYGDLFKRRGRYILGYGEAPPSDDEVERRRAQWMEVVPAAMSKAESYVLTDVNATIEFFAADGRVAFAGGPTYMLWRHAVVSPDDLARIRRQAQDVDRAALQDATVMAALEMRDAASELPQRQQDAIAREAGAVMALLRFQEGTLEFRQELLVYAQVVRARLEVELVPAAQNPLADPEVLAGLNSHVHAAATAMSRAAALYRYAREADPDGWRKFVRKLPRRTVPTVELPTTIDNDCLDLPN